MPPWSGPVLTSRRGLAISCGMNPRYGDFDTYWMAASADRRSDAQLRRRRGRSSAHRHPRQFLLGRTPTGRKRLGSLVRAALACHDVAIALGTPFISGKDSLNNEFRYVDSAGKKQSIAIPPSLLISALGQVDDVGRAVTDGSETPGQCALSGRRDERRTRRFALLTGRRA